MAAPPPPDPAWFLGALTQTSDLVLVIDGNADIVWANDAVTAQLGHLAPDFLGRSIADFLHPDDVLHAPGEAVDRRHGVVARAHRVLRLVLADRLLEAITGGASVAAQVELVLEMGRWRHPLEGYAIYYRDADGAQHTACSEVPDVLRDLGPAGTSPWDLVLADEPMVVPLAPVADVAAADAGFTALDSDRTAAEPAVLGKDGLADGNYRLRVRAIDGRGLEGLDGEREIVIDARPEPPFPSAPGEFATEEAVRFEWAHSPEATAYHFQLAADPDFERILLTRDDLQAAQLTLEDELPAGDYWWRVGLTTAAEGRGPYSDIQRFRRPPPGPAAEPPEVDGDVLQLRWRATDGAERYEVQFARSADFATPEHTLETTAAELAMPRPEGGTWHVRIRSQEAGGPPGPWSKPQQIEVPHSHWRALLILLPLLLAL